MLSALVQQLPMSQRYFSTILFTQLANAAFIKEEIRGKLWSSDAVYLNGSIKVWVLLNLHSITYHKILFV